MKKTITQQMVEELHIKNPLRTYFDAGSSQFNRTDFNEKIQTLERVVSSGYDLNKVIQQYKYNFSSDGYKHIHDNAIPTLIKYIRYLDNTINLQELEKAADAEVIKLLTDMILKKDKV